MASVYLCYQFRERGLADELAASLGVANAPLDTYDQRMRTQVSGEAATKLKAELTAAISRSAVFVTLVGPTTATSSWVNWELDQARQLDKPVLMARLSEDDALPGGANESCHLVSGPATQILEAIGRLSS